MSTDSSYRPSRAHLDLGGDFYDEVAAADFPQHVLRYRNGRAAAAVGLEGLSDEEWVRHFGLFEPLPDNLPAPLALRYHGHQFRSYNPNLGDGRGFLFAQLREKGSGRLLDLATKGSGRTPWSREGDGRLTLKGGYREVLAAAMLEALGVNTSKAFSLVETGENLVRNDEPSPTRSAVLVRLSHSHVRIGSFQRFAHLGETANVERLVDHCIRHYYPALAAEQGPARIAAFLAAVCGAVASTGAKWLAAGFAHGVLNTDNVNVTGESFDYGPWRFVPTFDLGFTAAYFDRNGIYSFGQQPTALAWNLARLAECLRPLADADAIATAQQSFAPTLQQAFVDALIARFGLASAGEARDGALLAAIYGFLTSSGAPLEQVFFDWFNGEASAARARRSPVAALYEAEGFLAVRRAWADHAPRDAAALDHAYFARAQPCSMLIEEVEAMWQRIAEADDWQAFHDKLADIRVMAAAYGLEAPIVADLIRS
ncbi:MAG TPA: YdiU family protein [Alphaproteobacteria bacterium]